MVGILGWGSEPHPMHQLEGACGSAVSSPSGVRGEAPAAKRFSSHLSTQDSLSWHFSDANYFKGTFITPKLSDKNEVNVEYINLRKSYRMQVSSLSLLYIYIVM